MFFMIRKKLDRFRLVWSKVGSVLLNFPLVPYLVHFVISKNVKIEWKQNKNERGRLGNEFNRKSSNIVDHKQISSSIVVPMKCLIYACAESICKKSVW